MTAMMTTILPTENSAYGFWGTSVLNGYDPEVTWPAASAFLADAFGLTPAETRDLLDRPFGRHLADELSFIKGGPTSGEAIVSHLTARFASGGWARWARAEIRGLRR